MFNHKVIFKKTLKLEQVKKATATTTASEIIYNLSFVEDSRNIAISYNCSNKIYRKRQ